MKNAQVSIDYSNVEITQITTPSEPTYAVFIDPDDDEPVIQPVTVWAVLEFYKSLETSGEDILVKTAVRGLTEMPDTPYLSDNLSWDNNFVGYFKPNSPTMDELSKDCLLTMLQDYRRRHVDDGRDSEKETKTEKSTTQTEQCPGTIINREDTNFWKGRIPGNPDWTDD